LVTSTLTATEGADCFQFGKHPLVPFFVSSKYYDGGPCSRQSERNAATNSAVPTSHDSHPAVKSNNAGIFIKRSPFRISEVAVQALFTPGLG